MGFSHVVASGILLTGVSLVAFVQVDAYFDREDALQSAWQDARNRDAELAQTSITILDVRKTAGKVHVTVENTGSTTLRANNANILLDGQPETISSIEIDGQASNVWPPGTVADFETTLNQVPDAASVTTEHGITAYWRA